MQIRMPVWPHRPAGFAYGGDYNPEQWPEQVWAEVQAVEAGFGDRGRVLLRPSGTEQLVRVMVEAPTRDLAERIGEQLATVVASVT